MAQQRQRVRHQDSGTQSLNRPRRDQRGSIGRERASNRRGSKDRKPRHEDALCADAVAERACREDEGGKGDGVGAHHPLQSRDRAAQRRADAVERGVDDGDVELHHAIAEAHRGKGQGGREFRLWRFVWRFMAPNGLHRRRRKFNGSKFKGSIWHVVTSMCFEVTRCLRLVSARTLRYRSNYTVISTRRTPAPSHAKKPRRIDAGAAFCLSSC